MMIKFIQGEVSKQYNGQYVQNNRYGKYCFHK
jgi:hypothetical protein